MMGRPSWRELAGLAFVAVTAVAAFGFLVLLGYVMAADARIPAWVTFAAFPACLAVVAAVSYAVGRSDEYAPDRDYVAAGLTERAPGLWVGPVHPVDPADSHDG